MKLLETKFLDNKNRADESHVEREYQDTRRVSHCQGVDKEVDCAGEEVRTQEEHQHVPVYYLKRNKNREKIYKQ